MRLSELLAYNDIVIQCHDNPDADALASGYALKWYFEKCGKPTNVAFRKAAISSYPQCKITLLLSEYLMLCMSNSD